MDITLDMKTLTAIAALILCACGAAPDATDGPAPVPSLEAAGLAGRGLAASSLPELQLLATARGRALLSHVVSCALPRGAAITAITRDGTPYSFAGALGLAPGWADHAPTREEHRRVAACVRARTIAAIAA